MSVFIIIGLEVGQPFQLHITQGGPHGKLLVRQQQKQATRLLATRTEQEPWQAGITFALLFEFRELLGQEAPDPSGYGLYPALTPKAEPR
jgi:hypothetical protein